MQAQIELEHIKIPFWVDISVELKNGGDKGFMVDLLDMMGCIEIAPVSEQDEDMQGRTFKHHFVNAKLIIMMPITTDRAALEGKVSQVVIEPVFAFEGTGDVWAEACSMVDLPDVTLNKRKKGWRR